jgi:hypothetical protein
MTPRSNDVSSKRRVSTTHEVMGVPESLVAELADLGVRGRIDEEHEDEHEVTSQTAGLREQDRPRGFFADLRLFDVDHVDV